jgi:hypothetical protein
MKKRPTLPPPTEKALTDRFLWELEQIKRSKEKKR